MKKKVAASLVAATDSLCLNCVTVKTRESVVIKRQPLPQLQTLLGALQTLYQSTASKAYKGAAGEYYPGLSAMPSGSNPGLKLDPMSSTHLGKRPYFLDEGTPRIIHSSGERSGADNPGTHQAATSGNGYGLIYSLGCADTKFYLSDHPLHLPDCVFGSGLYKFAGGVTSSPVKHHNLWESDAASTPWPDLYATALKTMSSAPTSTNFNGLHGRLNCLFLNYEFFITMLSCASEVLTSLGRSDSGCTTADYSKNRYGCLCRRRTRYSLVSVATTGSDMTVTKAMSCGSPDDYLTAESYGQCLCEVYLGNQEEYLGCMEESWM